MMSSYNLPFPNLTCSSKIHQKLIIFLVSFRSIHLLQHVCLSTLFLILLINPSVSLCVYRSKFTTHFHDFTSTFPFLNVTQSLFKINKFTFDYTPPIATCFSGNHVIYFHPRRLPIKIHHTPPGFYFNLPFSKCYAILN